jgi:hypothetical protein
MADGGRVRVPVTFRRSAHLRIAADGDLMPAGGARRQRGRAEDAYEARNACLPEANGLGGVHGLRLQRWLLLFEENQKRRKPGAPFQRDRASYLSRNASCLYFNTGESR